MSGRKCMVWIMICLVVFSFVGCSASDMADVGKESMKNE